MIGKVVCLQTSIISATVQGLWGEVHSLAYSNSVLRVMTDKVLCLQTSVIAATVHGLWGEVHSLTIETLVVCDRGSACKPEGVWH